MIKLRAITPLINPVHKDSFSMGLIRRKLQKNQLVQMYPAASLINLPQEVATQKNLPCLPVQPLDQMLDKYIRSVKPFVNSAELEKTKQLVKSFCEDDSIGKKLQKLLEERAKSMDNWLADWWLQTAYLEFRSPVIIYSSPGLVWPKKVFPHKQDQIMYAARLIKLALDFNKSIEKGKIPQERLGNNLLCMNQYSKIFGTCRIPKIPRDELSFQDSQNPSSNIIVMHNNNFYSLKAFKNKEREPFDASHFYSMLLHVANESEFGLPIGVLTTEQRDNWARTYEELKKVKRNKHILEEYIEKALFIVCLDKPVPSGVDHLDYDTRCSKLLLHGYGLRGNAGNRWYDKTLQFIVGAGEDGVGIVYEHSPAEGGPIGLLTDFINSAMNEERALEKLSDYPKPEKLEFIVSDTIEEKILSAGAAVDSLCDDLDVCGWHFSGFGKEELKRMKVSPDSFIQIAIQLAFYKLHARAAAQYESGSLRKFIYGRTDTIRSCTEEVAGFCEMMSGPSATSVEISRALRRALESHKSYSRDVIEGRGVDRHLLGLKILAKLNGMQDPEIFSDSAYERSTYFQLSTSNVPTKCDAFMVYGPLVHDGYACCYNPREQNINFGLSAWSSCEFTRLDMFKKSLEEALTSMRLCIANSDKVNSYTSEFEKMASVAHFLYDAENIIDEIESRLVAVEENSSRNFLCARTIQRIFRGYITRKHVALLHRSATVIQRNWRGFLGRIIYRARLKEKYNEMCYAWYNAKARVIQKWWRGFWVRLKVFSYYRLKSWLAFVLQQNKVLKCSVELSQSKANASEMRQREEEAKEWIVYILFKLHHLLRTHQLSGVYSLPNTTDLSEIEKLLKCLRYKDFMLFYDAYMNDLRRARGKELQPYILQECKYPGYYEGEFHGQKKPHGHLDVFTRDYHDDPPQTLICIEHTEKAGGQATKDSIEKKTIHHECKCARRSELDSLPD